MFKVAFRQMRSGVIVATLLLGILVVIALVTGFRMDHFYDQNIKSCMQKRSLTCGGFRAHFEAYFSVIRHIFQFISYVVPCVIGFIWGAPLFSTEFEKQTFKFSLTQSIKRTQWFISKYVVGMTATLAISVIMTTVVTWWFAKLDFIHHDKYSMLDLRNLSPVGYSIFAFTLGVFLGLLFKKQLSAIFTTLFTFVIVRVVVALFILPNLISPTTTTTAVSQSSFSGITIQGNGNSQPTPVLTFYGGPIPNAWVYSSGLQNDSGDEAIGSFMRQNCSVLDRSISRISLGKGNEPPSGPPSGLNSCIRSISKSYHVVVVYQPENRYWDFQVLNFLLYLVVSALLTVGAVFLLRRAE